MGALADANFSRRGRYLGSLFPDGSRLSNGSQRTGTEMNSIDVITKSQGLGITLGYPRVFSMPQLHGYHTASFVGGYRDAHPSHILCPRSLR